jgi:hypothetical protein
LHAEWALREEYAMNGTILQSRVLAALHELKAVLEQVALTRATK